MRRSISPGGSVTATLVRAVADETDRDPTDLRPLAEAVDAVAIDSLFTRSPGDGPETLTLLYEGCRIVVDGDAVTVMEVPEDD